MAQQRMKNAGKYVEGVAEGWLQLCCALNLVCKPLTSDTTVRHESQIAKWTHLVLSAEL